MNIGSFEVCWDEMKVFLWEKNEYHLGDGESMVAGLGFDAKVVSETWLSIGVVDEKKKVLPFVMFSVMVGCRCGLVLWKIEEAWRIVRKMVLCEKLKNEVFFVLFYEEDDICGWWWKGKAIWNSIVKRNKYDVVEEFLWRCKPSFALDPKLFLLLLSFYFYFF